MARNGSAAMFRWLMEKGLNALDEDGEQRSAVDLAHAIEILEIFKKER